MFRPTNVTNTNPCVSWPDYVYLFYLNIGSSAICIDHQHGVFLYLLFYCPRPCVYILPLIWQRYKPHQCPRSGSEVYGVGSLQRGGGGGGERCWHQSHQMTFSTTNTNIKVTIHRIFSFICKLQQGAKFAHLPRGEERFGLAQKKFLQYANT